MSPILYIVIPCFNEEKVLPITCEIFLNKINQLVSEKLINEKSKILFVNDGSSDKTWEIIKNLSKQDKKYIGISQSRNRGHQSSVLAGMMEVIDKCDICITIDCDGQDDINAMDEMVKAYNNGYDVVYGVRNNRDTDSFFKKNTAELYYKILNLLGGNIIYNHADYRLLSQRVLKEFSNYKEVNIFLRGMIPLVGFKSTEVYYKRFERKAGESHYPLKKMLALAFEGITSLSIKPIRIISSLGFLIAIFSFIGIIWGIKDYFLGRTVPGWASMTVILCFLGGIQLISLGIIGEYVGKTYLETKKRPRYIIQERTDNFKTNN